MIRCAIVDDEEMAINVTENHPKNLGGCEIVATCQSRTEAFAMIQSEAIDLLFLDIQMPGLTGIQLIRSLINPPLVILTTAFRDHAVEAFELDVADYLLKPISLPRMANALSKAHRLLANNGTPKPEAGTNISRDCIYLRVNREQVKIDLSTVSYIESLKNHVRVNLRNGQSLISLISISQLEKELPDDRFIRVHKQYIAAQQAITKFSHTAISIEHQVLPVGKVYRENLNTRMRNFLV